jgi:hypothetical protein
MTDDDTMALLARVRWLEAEVQRLIEHAAQAEENLARCEDALSRANKYGKEADERLAQAEADRDVLAAERARSKENDP